MESADYGMSGNRGSDDHISGGGHDRAGAKNQPDVGGGNDWGVTMTFAILLQTAAIVIAAKSLFPRFWNYGRMKNEK